MPDSKKKRPRKRQRKSKANDAATKEDVEEEGVEEEVVDQVQHDNLPTIGNAPAESSKKRDRGDFQPGPSTMSMPAEPDKKDASNGMNKSGPTLSFYQRTNPHKPSALSSLQGDAPRRYTVSIAIPGSIILNAQSPELQSRLAGQLARSCAIFNIDEIVVYNEQDSTTSASVTTTSVSTSRAMPPGYIGNGASGGNEDQDNPGHFDPNAFLARILQYVETPQYLRKSLFPMHRDLRMAGILAPLDCPHHLRYEEESEYREGVCVDPPHWVVDKKATTWVYTGLRDPIQCIVKGKSGEVVPLGARVTVKMPSPTSSGKKIGHIVSPREPTQEKGLYWGYTTRLCNSLSEAISSPCWNEPYDLVIGTSERGTSLTDVVRAVESEASNTASDSDPPTTLPPYRHALIVFGGLSGLEVAVEADPNINLSADDASELFDAWINVVEGQGSRTIRTEEALLITLARLKTTLETLGQR